VFVSNPAYALYGLLFTLLLRWAFVYGTGEERGA
jgi:hypothetical protein